MNRNHDCSRFAAALATDASAFVLAAFDDPAPPRTLELLEIARCARCRPRFETELARLAADSAVAARLSAAAAPDPLLAALRRAAAELEEDAPVPELDDLLALDDMLALAEGGWTAARLRDHARRALEAVRTHEGASRALFVLAPDALRKFLVRGVRELGGLALEGALPANFFERFQTFLDRQLVAAPTFAPTLGDALELGATPRLEARVCALPGGAAPGPEACPFEVLEELELERVSAASSRVRGRLRAAAELDPAHEWLFALYTDQRIHGFGGACLPLELVATGEPARFEGTYALELPFRLAERRMPLLVGDWRAVWRPVVLSLPPRRHLGVQP